jgi:glycosyltransferase involved in cell wall biosynthesis
MKLSIITINYNNQFGLEKTIKSVIGQTFDDYEYIIIDGGSTDGSVDVIKNYASKINYWVSEKDNGIYHAMNKGIKVATGDYCLFMNSSDVIYRPDTLEEVFRQNICEDVVYGNLVSAGHLQISVDRITLLNFLTHTIGHQSAFIKRSLLVNNPYDENLRIVSDWKFFFQELILNNASYKKINTIIADFDATGISMNNQDYLKQEHDQELKKIFPPIVYEEIYKYFGVSDKYYELFINIGESPNKKRFYNTIVTLLKIFMLNRGWSKKLSRIK